MSDLSEYFSKLDRIKELEIELELMTKRFKAEQGYKSKYKIKLERLEKESRTSKALKLISELRLTGKPGKLIKEIAGRCFLSECHVQDLWYKS